jgi:hypothetical protein
MKIEMSKKYTSNSESIRIICIDRPGEYPIIGMMEKTRDIHFFKENGEHTTFRKYNLIELWEPQVGEWCLFWDYTEQSHVYLDRFDRVDGFGSFLSNAGVYWIHCAKFSGELPEHLKEKQEDYK